MSSPPVRNGVTFAPSRILNESPNGRPIRDPLQRNTSSASRTSFRASPQRRRSIDSPSRQLLEDLCRWHIESDRNFQEKLDLQAKILEEQHRKALDVAKEKHDAVIQRAEREREVLQLHVENEKLRREQAEAERMERARREKLALEAADRDRQHQLVLQREQEAIKQRKQERRLAEAEARVHAENEKLALEQQQREESAKEQQALESQRRAQAEQAATEKTQQAAKAASAAPAVQPPPSQTAAGAATSVLPATPASSPLMPWDELASEHTQYLALHQKLKANRKSMLEMYRKHKGNKSSPLAQMVEMRRQTQKLMGQTTDDRPKNKQIRDQIQAIMRIAWNITDVALDAREYIIRPNVPWPAGANTQVSGVFIYLLNMLTKAAIAQMNTSSRQTAYNAIDYLGVILSWIASQNEFRLHGNSFADIIIAKFHHTCPPLFGIYGPENTTAGRQRLGWRTEHNELDHSDRVSGVSIGWAALTLRDYSKVRATHNLHSAIPQWHYWRSLASIVNVPPHELTKTHALALKGLVDRYAGLFVKFYGQAAKVALHRAVVELPALAPESAGFDSVSVLRETIASRFRLVV